MPEFRVRAVAFGVMTLLTTFCLQLNAADVTPRPAVPTSQAFLEQAVADSAGREWRPLFNGKNLEGWKVVLQGKPPGADPESIFQVVNEEIHVYRDTPAGKQMPFGVILSDESFSEYRFRFEYRWGEKKFAPRVNLIRDAGLLFHTVGPEKIWPMSVECQVQEGDTGDNYLVYTGCKTPVDVSGKTFLDVADGGQMKAFATPGGVTRVVKSETLERDGWNTVEVIVRKDAAIYIVNGKINNYLVEMTAPIGPNQEIVPLISGRLALQCEGAELFYRKLELLDLAPESKTTFTPADESIAPIPPRSPEEGLAAWKVRDGLRVELVASEPLVLDPVAIDWGLDGRLWVIEMADYPLGLDGKGKPGGRIRMLERSSSGNGYDRSTLFLDGINFPTGIVAWKNGVIVTAAPEIFYAEDTDGDGVCDRRQVLFSGFHEGNHQLRINGLRWGLDGWLHCASGSHHAGYGSKIHVFSHLANKEFPLGSRDFRLNVDTGELEPLSGPSQFGRNRDDWGNWFGVQNSFPLWHYVYEDRYLQRNPHFATPDARVLLTESNPRVFPVAEIGKQPNPMTQVGRFTSACSGMIYRDQLLPLGTADSHAFTCEPVHNLIQHQLLTRTGVTFQATRDATGESHDFLASTDPWCRPVMVRTGPDGALWVVDLYRYLIEHPEWVPKAAQEEMAPFLRLGDGRGRIYRVLPATDSARDVPNLLAASPQELVSLLSHPNGWVRDGAQRRIVERHDLSMLPDLKEVLRTGPDAIGRLHALYTLSLLNELAVTDCIAALGDNHPDVRRHALILSESQQTPTPEHWAAIEQRIEDPSDAVRLQLAFSLGEWRHPAAVELMARHWRLPKLDSRIQVALCSSLNSENVAAAVEAASLRPADQESTFSQYRQLIRQSIAMGNLQPVRTALARSSQSESDLVRAMIALDQAASRPEAEWEKLDPVAVDAVFNQIPAFLESQSAPVWMRVECLPLLLTKTPTRDRFNEELLLHLLSVNGPTPMKNAVIQSLGRQKDVRAGMVLLAGWSGYLPDMKTQVLESLVNRPEWHHLLVKSLDQNLIQPGEISLTLKERLLSQKKSPAAKELRQRLEMKSGVDIANADEVLQLNGDLRQGRLIFLRHCSECHQFQGEGILVGPNLSSVTGRTPVSLLEAIVDPNRAVEPRYLNYSISLADGRVLSGLIAHDSDSSLTLLKARGETQDVLRTEIEELRSTGKSLMPEGFDKTIPAQDLADLILYLQQTGSPVSTP